MTNEGRVPRRTPHGVDALEQRLVLHGESRAGLRTESENKGLNAVTTHAEAPAPEKTN